MDSKFEKIIEGGAKTTSRKKVLEVKDLRISFKTDNGKVQAVRGVSFDLYKGETLCIVGESGSGKSVTSKAIMGILSTNAIVEGGQIIYEGEDLLKVSEDEFHRIRGHKIGMIFQDPLSSLNPIVKIGKQITETMLINKNQLKNRYSDLISKELTDYKNAKVIKNSAITQAQVVYNDICSELDDKEGALKKKLDEDINIVSEAKNVSSKGKSMISAKEMGLSDIEDKYKKIINESSLTKKIDILLSIKGTEKSLLSSAKKNIVNAQNAKERISEANTEIIQSNVDMVKDFIETRKSEIASIKEQMTSAPQTIKYTEPLINEDKAKYDAQVAEDKPIREKAKGVFNDAKDEASKVYKDNLPALKAALKASKKEAKVEVDKYASELKAKYEADLAVLENERKNVVIPSSNQEKIDVLTKQIKAVNRKYKAKMLIHWFSEKKRLALSAKQEAEVNLLQEEKDKYLAPFIAIDKKEDDLKREYQNKTKITKSEAKRHALEVMKEVGIPQAERRYYQYPFQFSGGMRQRIVIAIALTAAPDILICDEPTTALDVTIQAQILELINKLKRERNLSCIFITHDLGVVANMADRVAVMYAGKICEYGTDKEIFFDPRHPYTWALLSSIPDIDSKEKLEAIPGTPPDMIFPPVGDAFAARNKYAMAIDYKYQPPYFKISDTHYAATWLLYKDAPHVEPPKIVTTRIKKALEEEAKYENK